MYSVVSISRWLADIWFFFCKGVSQCEENVLLPRITGNHRKLSEIQSHKRTKKFIGEFIDTQRKQTFFPECSIPSLQTLVARESLQIEIATYCLKFQALCQQQQQKSLGRLIKPVVYRLLAQWHKNTKGLCRSQESWTPMRHSFVYSGGWTRQIWGEGYTFSTQAHTW